MDSIYITHFDTGYGLSTSFETWEALVERARENKWASDLGDKPGVGQTSRCRRPLLVTCVALDGRFGRNDGFRIFYVACKNGMPFQAYVTEDAARKAHPVQEQIDSLGWKSANGVTVWTSAF